MIPTSTSHLYIHIRQAFFVIKKKRTELPRRNTEGVVLSRVPPFLTRKKWKKAVTTTVAVIRFRNLLEKKTKEDEDDAVPPTVPTEEPESLVCSCRHRGFDFPKVVCTCFPLSWFHVHR